jgi:valyl-tRNA synthetase
MPFVTEQAWGAIPHRASDPDLLIVARWPAPAGRDERVEIEVEAILELVRGLRNARAESRVEAGTWLPTEVVVPMAMGPTFEALRPAIERLARARPLERRLTREALGQGSASKDGALAVIVGELEALAHRVDGTGDGTGRDAERARLERELAEARGRLQAARARLANEAFVAKAPPNVVEVARAREAELTDQVGRLEDRLADLGS